MLLVPFGCKLRSSKKLLNVALATPPDVFLGIFLRAEVFAQNVLRTMRLYLCSYQYAGEAWAPLGWLDADEQRSQPSDEDTFQEGDI